MEWPEKVEVLVDRLERESSERALRREERALMDVYETVPILESEEGLHGFWHSGVDHQRVIKSFDLVGASTLVDALNASRWCETRSEDLDDYSETEADYLGTIEEDLAAGLDELGDPVDGSMMVNLVNPVNPVTPRLRTTSPGDARCRRPFAGAPW